MASLEVTPGKYESLAPASGVSGIPWALANAPCTWNFFLFCVLPVWVAFWYYASALIGSASWHLVLLPLTVPLLYGILFLGLPGVPPCRCLRDIAQAFQVWALQHPRHPLSRSTIPVIAVMEGLAARRPDYLIRLRDQFGENFCCAGMVVLGKWEETARALVAGQARCSYLGSQPLIASKLPGVSDRRNLFLLAMSDVEPESDHHAFRACMMRYLFDDAAEMREYDDVADVLFATLVRDYRQMQGLDFFSSARRGWMPFWIKYCHYVLLGLDPDDEQIYAALAKLFKEDGPMMAYLEPAGHFPFLSFERDILAVAKIYETSPALKEFEENCPAFHSMSKRQLICMVISIVRILAITGTTQLAKSAMGQRDFPQYPGAERITKARVEGIWDELPLLDHEAVSRFIYECIRLDPPVASSHRVADEPLTAVVRGKPCDFPKGTRILIGSGMAMMDKNLWGPTVYEFDYKRPNLVSHFMGFNGVGDRSAGRICPARYLVTNTLVKVLQRVGQVRRSRMDGSESPR